jgi:hypothetical protein
MRNTLSKTASSPSANLTSNQRNYVAISAYLLGGLENERSREQYAAFVVGA